MKAAGATNFDVENICFKMLRYLLHHIYFFAAYACPDLEAPSNGKVTVEERPTYFEATYECTNRRLWISPIYLRTRICELRGWNGSSPQCGK